MQKIVQDISYVRKDSYYCDFMLSIGPECRPAMNLRSNHLRDFSSPLDWMMSYSLDTVLHLFRTGFNDFFAEYEVDKNKKGANGMLRVTDVQNNIVSIHFFPERAWMSVTYPIFIERMSARAKRLDQLLQNASCIVLVGDRTESRELIWDFLKSFSSIYPHLKLRLINIRNDERISYEGYEVDAFYEKENLSYFDYSVNDTQQGIIVPEGNSFVWTQILSKYITQEYAKNAEDWFGFRKKSRKLLIYGAGKRCVCLLNYLDGLGISVDGIVVASMTDNPKEINGISVAIYSKYSKDSSIIISLANSVEAQKVGNNLQSKGFCNTVYVDDNMKLIMVNK